MSTSNNAMVELREEAQGLANVLASPEYTGKLKQLLPSDIPVDRFRSVVLLAVQQNPDLMKKSTDKKSLLLACQRAAKDGLVPDGREGALVMYGNVVQWQPMIGGLRKRLADLGFTLRADVVYANDTFDYDLGDDPRITHKPPPLGHKRGDVIGAYAIATDEAGHKYREVMSKEDIDYIRSKSKSGPTWNNWYGEMAKKTVARRLIKQLSLGSRDDRLSSTLESDDEATGIAEASRGPVAPSETAQRVQAAARAAAKPVDTGNAEKVGAGVIDGDTRPAADAHDEEIAGEFRDVTGQEGGQGAQAEF